MLRIDCPFCGKRNHDEFSYEGDASVTYPEFGSDDKDAWYRAVFLRKNPRGAHVEYWYHSAGCKMWLAVERDTVTHEIGSVIPAHPDYVQALSQKKVTS